MRNVLRSLARPLGARRPRVLVFIDLVQDIDVLLPVIVALKREPHLSLKVAVSRWLEQESPRTASRLKAASVPFAYVRRREVIAGLAPSLGNVAAVIAASESSHEAHAAAHALARRAASLGLGTYAVQHGLENVGLFGIEAEAAMFASQTVFCWFPPEATPPSLPADTKAKLVHAGRASPTPRGDGPAPPPYRLGVFENLHWDRYTDADREAFRVGLLAVARALPDARILVRPHPAGGWADRLGHELAQFVNMTLIAASDARSAQESGAEAMQGIERVITTPSTVALDAALAGRPVALAAPGGEIYAPLPVLTGPEDWIAFAGAQTQGLLALDQFRARVLVEGDGAARIVERLRRDLEGPPTSLA